MQKLDLEKQAGEIGIDVPTLISLYKIFIEQTEHDIIELESFISGKNVMKVRNTAHHIKGACMNLEIYSLVEIAAHIEKISVNESWDETISLLKAFTAAFDEVKASFKKELYE